MKRKFLAIALMLVMLFGVAYTAAQCNPTPPPHEFNFDVSFMKQLKTADLAGAHGLGVGTKADAAAANAAGVEKMSSTDGTLSIAITEAAAEDDKNYLWVANETGLLEQVTFTVSTSTPIEVVDPETGGVTEIEGEVTQDELPAQVNKAVFSRGFTFVQFVPVLPNAAKYNQVRDQIQYRSKQHSDLLKSENGKPCRFDRGAYWTDQLHAGFVIDNTTGEIYSLTNVNMMDDINSGRLMKDELPECAIGAHHIIIPSHHHCGADMVRFRIEGLNLERQLNTLVKSGVNVCCVRSPNRQILLFEVPSNEKNKVVDFFSEACYNIQVLGVRGAAKPAHFFRRRLALLAALVIGCSFLLVFSGFVWRVEFDLDERADKALVQTTLKDNCVWIGSWVGGINYKEAQNLIFNSLPEVKCVSVSVSGRTLFVAVRTELPEPLFDFKTLRDIVARQDGITHALW